MSTGDREPQSTDLPSRVVVAPTRMAEAYHLPDPEADGPKPACCSQTRREWVFRSPEDTRKRPCTKCFREGGPTASIREQSDVCPLCGTETGKLARHHRYDCPEINDL